MIDIGGYYHLKHYPGEQFLSYYGHSVAGQTENYGYIGMYFRDGHGDALSHGAVTELQGNQPTSEPPKQNFIRC